jgi:hypothetical protein
MGSVRAGLLLHRYAADGDYIEHRSWRPGAIGRDRIERSAGHDRQSERRAQHTVASFFNTAAFVATPLDADRPGNAGRGVVTGPSFQRWDFSLFKNSKLRGENMYLQFRAETFNLFNHTNYSTVTTGFISASFGEVTAANDARIMQLGLKLYF